MGNNPVMMVDPDGELAFLAVVAIVAVVGGTANAIANHQNINNFWDGLYYFGVGAAVGAGATVGGAALAPVLGTGAIAGATFGAAGGFVTGYANTGYATGNWGREAFSAGGKGALFGGITGGVLAGAIAGFSGNNVWTGAQPTPGSSVFSFKDVGSSNGPSFRFGDAEKLTKDFWKYGYNPKGSVEVGDLKMNQFGDNPEVKIDYNQAGKKFDQHAFSKNRFQNIGSNSDVKTQVFNTVQEVKPMLLEGSNQIVTRINGQVVTVRVFVQNGTVINVNAFPGESSRVIGGTLIDLLNK